MLESDLPKIGAPATLALASIGITRLEQVADRSVEVQPTDALTQILEGG